MGRGLKTTLKKLLRWLYIFMSQYMKILARPPLFNPLGDFAIAIYIKYAYFQRSTAKTIKNAT